MEKARGEAVMSLEDWNTMEETLYLTSSPANASRLAAAIAQLEAANTWEDELAEE